MPPSLAQVPAALSSADTLAWPARAGSAPNTQSDRFTECAALPEQANWIDQVLSERKIGAKSIWYSHWEFENADESEKFEVLLIEFSATEEKINL